jgi:hypothetical protein
MKRTNKVVMMKKVFLIGALLGILNFAQAIPVGPGSYTFNAPADMLGNNALVGTYAYLWDVGSITLAAGDQITSAQISFTGVEETASGSGNDISVDMGIITNGMAGLSGNPPPAGKDSVFTDNDAQGDAFTNNITKGIAVRLGTQLFPQLNAFTNFSYTFTTSELNDLTNYMNGLWGFEIDPDCHFTVSNICFTYTVAPTNKVLKAPEAPATAGLLGLVLLVMFIVHRRFAKIFHLENASGSGYEKSGVKLVGD